VNTHKALFADVILPLPLANTYTYTVSVEWSECLCVGMRVAVSVKNKIYTALVYKLHHEKPSGYELKPVMCVLDEKPVVLASQLKFWEWIANYYQCYLGDVYKAALPSGLKPESETTVTLLFLDDEQEAFLTPKQWKIIHALNTGKKEHTIAELAKIVGGKDVLPQVKTLLEKGLIAVSENLRQNYKPKTESYIRLNSAYKNEEKLVTVLDSMKRSKKQADVLLAFLDLQVEKKDTAVSRKELTEKTACSAVVLKSLIEKGILDTYEKEIGRLDLSEKTVKQINALNTFQQAAHEKICRFFAQNKVVLLHGVTSSGKTEIYIHLIQEALSQGKQVLYLLPEIALTSQLTTRLKSFFGNKLGVYHSKFSDAERVEIWNNLLQKKGYEVIIGVRSSVFLPFSRLGLVIVDEEHENTYKQYDPAPRYHARNAAVVLAAMHGANTLLGTATPAIETYNNAYSGKYALVELIARHEEIALPEIIAVDTKELRRKKQMSSLFSPLLLEKMQQTLANKEQVILFQNRRGYAPFVECAQCGYVPKCKNCDVSLTVHKAFNALTCHYCGYTETILSNCPHCGNQSLETKGYGTEKIEEEIQTLFPDAVVARMDLDTTRSKNSYERIIADFEQKKIDILVGTQMISKGLDFEHVSLVGILNADNMLNYPDFRAHERAYQLMAQVSGRAGRKNKQGTVILQTSDVNHPIVKQVIGNDYKAMFAMQMHERYTFKYPPYFRLIYIMLKHKELALLNRAAGTMATELRAVFGFRVLGPDNPPVLRIQNLYLKRIMLKIESDSSNEKAKELIRTVTAKILSSDRFKSLQIQWDVDPM